MRVVIVATGLDERGRLLLEAATIARTDKPLNSASGPRSSGRRAPGVKGGEKPDQRAEQNTATAAFGVRWSEGVGMRPGAVSAGNEGRA